MLNKINLIEGWSIFLRCIPLTSWNSSSNKSVVTQGSISVVEVLIGENLRVGNSEWNSNKFGERGISSYQMKSSPKWYYACLSGRLKDCKIFFQRNLGTLHWRTCIESGEDYLEEKYVSFYSVKKIFLKTFLRFSLDGSSLNCFLWIYRYNFITLTLCWILNLIKVSIK